jgi:hypothetical protein
LPAIYHPGVVQVVPHYDIGAGHDVVNVLYFQSTGRDFTTAQLSQVQTVFNSHWYTIWSPLASTQNKYKGSIVTDMSDNTGAQVDNTGYAIQPGGAGASPVYDGACQLIQLKTSTRYRGGHGRLYMPGIDTSVTTGDGRSMESSHLATTNTQLGVLYSAMIAITGTYGGPWQPVVWHKKLSSAPNTVENINQYLAVTLMATQRRRVRKVSRHRRRVVVTP